MPGKVNESIWERAKKQARKQYPEFGRENPRYWKVVSSIYQKMGGAFSKKAEKSIADIIAKCEQLEKSTPSVIMDKSLWQEISKDIQELGVDVNSPNGMLLHTINYAISGGHYIQKSEEDMNTEGLMSHDEITKSNIASSFADNKFNPISDMLKAVMPGIMKMPHRYLDRVKTKAGHWRYVYKRPGVKTEAKMQEQKKPGEKAPTPAQLKPTAKIPKSINIIKIIENLKKKTIKEQEIFLSKLPTEIAGKIRSQIRTSPDVNKSLDVSVNQSLEKSEDEQIAERIASGALGALPGVKEDYTPSAQPPVEKSQKEQIKMGKEVEKEHLPTLKDMKKDCDAGKLKPLEHYVKGIAKDHLKEFSDYYTRLTKMEKEAEASVKKSFGNDEGMEDWVKSREVNVVGQLRMSYPALAEDKLKELAREYLTNMYKKGLR